MRRFPDRRYFERIARETGFRAEPLETVFRLSDLLVRVTEELGDDVSLRGGTALNLIYLDLPRLSVDIDLDFVGTTGADEAQGRRPEVIQRLDVLSRDAGYEAVQERPSYAMAHLRLRYQSAQGRPAFIKLDVNFLDRVPVLPTEHRTLRHPFGDDLPQVEIQTLALAELAAGKTIALVRRGLARDLFDVAMFAGIDGLEFDALRAALVVRGASYPPPSPAEYSTEACQRVRPVRWRSEVLALARRPLPLTLEEARQRAGKFLGQAIRLEERHLSFLRALDRGELRPELLRDEELRDRIAINPGLLWRLRVGAEAVEER